jgi:hypothetical protein
LSTKRPIPLTLEIVDPERVETPPGLINNKLVIRLGVEHDESGESSAITFGDASRRHVNIDLNYDFYPAERVLHVFEAALRRDSPAACRG